MPWKIAVAATSARLAISVCRRPAVWLAPVGRCTLGNGGLESP